MVETGARDWNQLLLHRSCQRPNWAFRSKTTAKSTT